MTAPAPDAHPAVTGIPPEQAAYETWQETRWPGRVPVPWNHPATAASREAWRAAVQAATGQVLRKLAEARAERDELDGERREWRGKAVAQRTLLAEILDTPEVKIYAPRGSYAEWRQRAELEDS